MLMSAQHREAQTNQTEACQMAEKAALQPSSHQDTKPERQHRSTPHLILSAHKKHPLHQCMQGV